MGNLCNGIEDIFLLFCFHIIFCYICCVLLILAINRCLAFFGSMMSSVVSHKRGGCYSTGNATTHRVDIPDRIRCKTGYGSHFQ